MALPKELFGCESAFFLPPNLHAHRIQNDPPPIHDSTTDVVQTDPETSKSGAQLFIDIALAYRHNDS